jgi:uncharacterized protein (DUF2267 family)
LILFLDSRAAARSLFGTNFFYVEERKMEELVRKVAERTGLSEDQAHGAVEAVLGFLKERLPAPCA